MKSIFCICFFLTIQCFKVNAQSDTVVKFATNILYLEIAGPGGFGSLNFEKLFLNENLLKAGFRSGVSTGHILDYVNKFNPDIILTFAINSYYGNNHKLETGIGQTISNIVHFDTSEGRAIRKTNFSSNLTLGYRYQQNDDGILFRCSYTPILENNKKFRNWFGFSFGYAF
jgi:hypothetical protein